MYLNSCELVSVGFFTLSKMGCSGKEAGQWMVVNTALELRNGLKEPAALHLLSAERAAVVWVGVNSRLLPVSSVLIFIVADKYTHL